MVDLPRLWREGRRGWHLLVCLCWLSEGGAFMYTEGHRRLLWPTLALAHISFLSLLLGSSLISAPSSFQSLGLCMCDLLPTELAFSPPLAKPWASCGSQSPCHISESVSSSLLEVFTGHRTFSPLTPASDCIFLAVLICPVSAASSRL